MPSPKFTLKAENALNNALKYAKELGHTYIGSEHLLLGLLSDPECACAKALASRGVNFDAIYALVSETTGLGSIGSVKAGDTTPKLKRILERASFQSKNQIIGTEHLLSSLILESDCCAHKILESAGADLNDILTELKQSGFNINGAYESAVVKGSDPAMMKMNGAFALEGCPTLNIYGKNLTEAALKGETDPVIGRESETERLIQILSRRTKNNPCLIGEPGVGKTAVIEGLAQKIATKSVPENLRGKEIVTLDLAAMIAGSKFRGEFEERIKNAMNEVKRNGSVILFIDEIHIIVSAGAAEGAVDAANILKPALSRGEIQVIGATTLSEYRRHIEKDAALERRFQPVIINEPTPEDTIKILEGLRARYEEYHRITISEEAIKAAVFMSVRYINDRYLPDKAIDLIDEAASRLKTLNYMSPLGMRETEKELENIKKSKESAILSQNFEEAARLRDSENECFMKLQKEKELWISKTEQTDLVLKKEDISEVLTSWTGVPVKKIEKEESYRLTHLEDLLNDRVIGQNEAVGALSRAIKRGRTGLSDPNKPVSSFIFIGPTGVGKTELAKALAELLFGSVDSLIRFDMSEYMEQHSISKLLGSPPGYIGYNESGLLTEKVRRKPYSVVLFDEIEKAHPDIFGIFLQILDEGSVTDSQGRKTDFRNTVIIMTSNVGSGNISEMKTPGFSANDFKSDADISSEAKKALKKSFSPEFLNRADEIIVFKRLNGEALKKICKKLLSELSERVKNVDIFLDFDDSVPSFLSNEVSNAQYGARPMKRLIVREVENLLSQEILEGKINKGDKIKAFFKDNRIVFEKENRPQ